MSQTDSFITQAASVLATRRRHGQQRPRLPEACRPTDIDTALAIQSAVGEQLGDRIAAWKCGMPLEGRVILAPIYAGTVHGTSPCPARVRSGQVRIEPELAFVLGQDLPRRDTPYTSAEVDAAIVRTHLALELIDSRYSEPGEVSYVENLADGLLNQGLYIGPQVDNETARVASSFTIHVTPESGEELRFDGRHPNSDPRLPLYWLAEYLRSTGRGLQAGQAIITGSYAGSFDVPAEQAINIRYGDLGELTVRFVAK